MDRRTFAAALLVAAPRAWGQPDGKVEKLEKDLAQAKLDFAKGKATAKKTALGRFDTAIRVIKAQPLRPTEKQGLVSELESAKQRFDQQGHWPDTVDLLDAGLNFGLALSLAYTKVSAAFERLVKAHQDAGTSDAARSVTDGKTKFEATELPGRAEFVAGISYHGQRRGVKKVIPAKLDIKALTGPVITAVYAQDMGARNHPVLKMKGSIDGIRVVCETTEVTQGDVRALILDGLVLGDRLLVGIGGIASSGKPADGLMTLGRKG